MFERFGLDPSKPEDVAAAIAFRWAQIKGPWQIGGPATGPAMPAMAESVMRAVRADPALLAGLLSGDAKTLEAVRSVVQATASGGEIVTRNAEERQLVAEMTKAGKSRKEIEDALDALRKSRGEAGRTIRPRDPDDLLRMGWVEISHPSARASGRRTFQNPQTGEILEFDKGKAGASGFRARDHYHRPNPNKTGSGDAYLDKDGNPVSDKHNRSLYFLEKIDDDAGRFPQLSVS